MVSIGIVERRTGSDVLAAVGVVVVAGYVTAVLGLADRVSYSVWGAVMLGPPLYLLGALIVARNARRLGDPWLLQVGLLALAAKLIAGLARWWMAYGLYGGVSDSAGYSGKGAALAPAFRHLDFSGISSVTGQHLIGTAFLAIVTGVVYAITGPTLIGGYLVFAWLGFWGLFLSYLAFRRAVPGGHHRRYAVLIFFLPSMLFWPTALGKDAWMSLWVGALMYGAACVLTGRTRGWWWIAAGVAGSIMVRPHITALVFFGFVTAVLVRRATRRTSLTPVIRTVAAVAVGTIGVVLAAKAAAYVGASSLSPSQITLAMDQAGARTEIGGSAFTPTSLTSPIGVPMAFVTVLFRPLPFEAHNLQVLLAALDGTILLWLSWVYRRSVLAGFRMLRDSPWVAMCIAYTVMFVIAFSGFANFGILARERAQVYPAFLALLCLPVVSRGLNWRTDSRELADILDGRVR